MPRVDLKTSIEIVPCLARAVARRGVVSGSSPSDDESLLNSSRPSRRRLWPGRRWYWCSPCSCESSVRVHSSLASGCEGKLGGQECSGQEDQQRRALTAPDAAAPLERRGRGADQDFMHAKREITTWRRQELLVINRNRRRSQRPLDLALRFRPCPRRPALQLQLWRALVLVVPDFLRVGRFGTVAVLRGRDVGLVRVELALRRRGGIGLVEVGVPLVQGGRRSGRRRGRDEGEAGKIGAERVSSSSTASTADKEEEQDALRRHSCGS